MAAKTSGSGRPSRASQLMPDRRIALYLLAGLLLMVAVFFGFTHRMQAQHTAVQDSIALARKDIAATQVQLNQLQSGQLSPKDEQAEIARYDALLPAKIDAAALASDLPTEAQSTYNVSVTQMDPGTITDGPHAGLKFQPFNVSVAGSAADIAQWLAALQQRPDLLTVTGVNYTADTKAAGSASAGSSTGTATAGSSASAPVTKLSFTLKAWFDTSPTLPVSAGATGTG